MKVRTQPNLIWAITITKLRYSSISEQLVQQEVQHIIGMTWNSGRSLPVEKTKIQVLTFLQNPVQDVLTLNTTAEIDNIFVYNMTGQTFEVSRISEYSYDVCGLSNSVYTVLVINLEGNNLVGKVLKD